MAQQARGPIDPTGPLGLKWPIGTMWARNDPKLDENEHRGHQIEDFDSKMNIPKSKYIRKAQTTPKIEINFFIFFCNCFAGPNGLYVISDYLNKRESAI